MKTSPGTTHTLLRHSAFFILHSALALSALNAATTSWTDGAEGDWSAPENWQGGAVPATSATITIGSGSIAIGTTATTGAASLGSVAGSTARVTIGNGGYWMANSPTNAPSGTFFVGETGTAHLTIQSGGTLITGGTNNDGNWNRIGGDNAGAYGKVVIETGGYWSSGGMHLGGVGSSGIVHVETGGTLVIRNATAYIARYANSYGELNVDGYLETGAGGTYYIPVGYTDGSTGVFTVGSTGTVFAAQLAIANGVGSTGTATISGLYQASGGNTAAGTAGLGYLTITNGGTLVASTFYVGQSGTGIMTIEKGGYLYSSANSWMGRNDGSSGTAFVAGLWETNPANYLVVGAGGTYSTGASAAASYLFLSGTLNTMYANIGATNAGSMGYVIVQSGGYLNGAGSNTARIGGAAGCYGSLVIEDGGTVRMGGMSIGYGGAATGTATGFLHVQEGGILITWTTCLYIANQVHTIGTVIVDGYYESGNNGTYYQPVGYTANAYGAMYVGATGTVSSAQMDIGREAGAHGYVEVAGLWKINSGNTAIGNSGTGHLNILETGTVATANVNSTIGSAAGSSGTATIAGVWQVGVTGGNLTNASSGKGVFSIRSTGTVNVAGNFSQGANGTLIVQLEPDRTFDFVADTTTPLLNINGSAILSGTLKTYGYAIANIPEFKWDSNGYARASKLTGIPVLRATGGISGDFTSVKIYDGPLDGQEFVIPSNLPDFIASGGLKVNEGGPLDTRYDIGYGLAWKGGPEKAHGNFTIDAGKTFEVDAQLSNRPAGVVFASGWDGKSLHKKGDGTLILSVANNFTGATIVESGTLRFAGPARHTLGPLLNNGHIDFYSKDINNNRIGGYRTITATTLAGDGFYRMDVDLSTGASDRLVITGDAIGSHRLLIAASGGTPKGNEPTATLVTIGGVNKTDITAEGQVVATGSLFTGNFDYGLFKYEIRTLGNGTVIIANTGINDVHVYDQIRSGAGSQSLLWFDQQDNVNRRLGELRAPRENGTGFDIWARGHASTSTAGSATSSADMPEFDVDIWGAEIGSDHTWQLDDQRASLGIYIGIASASQKFARLENQPAFSRPTAESDMFGLGLYATWLADSGWFANATATISQYKNNFESRDGSNNGTKADYKDHAFGLSAEAGRRFALTQNGWFLEPSLHGAIMRLARADYTARAVVDRVNNYVNVTTADTTVSRLRGAIRVGRAWQTARSGWFEIAGRLAATRESSTGGRISITSDEFSDLPSWRPNLDGTRCEAGVGFFWKPSFLDNSQFYIDHDYATGNNYTKHWGLSLGFRLSL